MNMNPTYTLTFADVFVLPAWVQRMFTFFADDVDDDDVDDDAFDDDIDNAFGDDDGEPDDDDEEEGDDEDGDDDDDDKKSKKTSKKDRSAIVQKKRYREQVKKLKAEVDELKGKNGGEPSDEEKKEIQAKQYLANTIRDVLKEMENEDAQKSEEEKEQFEEELEELLDENENLSEKKVRSVAKEFEVSPRTAAKIIERERKLSKREKPKMPKEKRASTRVTKDEDDDKKEPRTLDSIGRRIKERISKGEL